MVNLTGAIYFHATIAKESQLPSSCLSLGSVSSTPVSGRDLSNLKCSAAFTWEVIVVDDCSLDGTAIVAQVSNCNQCSDSSSGVCF